MHTITQLREAKVINTDKQEQLVTLGYLKALEDNDLPIPTILQICAISGRPMSSL